MKVRIQTRERLNNNPYFNGRSSTRTHYGWIEGDIKGRICDVEAEETHRNGKPPCYKITCGSGWINLDMYEELLEEHIKNYITYDR
jgi:hypothetical protein